MKAGRTIKNRGITIIIRNPSVHSLQDKIVVRKFKLFAIPCNAPLDPKHYILKLLSNRMADNKIGLFHVLEP